MVLNKVCAIVFCTALLTGSALAAADQYRPDQLLHLDLSKAVLSPKPLGPPAAFEPVPIEAKADRKDDTQARAEPTVEPRVRRPQVAHMRVAQPHTARLKLARHHGNPLDAQASDTRIQTWPCKSGGICAWKR